MEENQFKVTDQTEIVVYALEYLKNLVKLLKITPKRYVLRGTATAEMKVYVLIKFFDRSTTSDNLIFSSSSSSLSS